MKLKKILGVGAVFGLIVSLDCGAGEAKAPPKIADNSFLIEEAYNQEPGVIQHINTYQYNREDHSWMYTFTEEIPVPNQAHQFSFMLPVARVVEGDERNSGLADMMLNYRYQLFCDERVAIAPRASVLLPTGDDEKGLGSDRVGYQVNLPVSLDINPDWSMHWNLGATYYNQAVDGLGNEADTLGLFYGVSVISCLTPTFNLMAELVGGSDEDVVGMDTVERSNWLYINPGMRFAINFQSGLQVVPGISFPIGIGPSEGETSVLLYLSLEHPAF